MIKLLEVTNRELYYEIYKTNINSTIKSKFLIEKTFSRFKVVAIFDVR